MKTKREAKILVVDDTEAVRFAVVAALKHFGYQHIFQANDGGAGMQMIMDHRSDLVITDLTMPVMDGWELIAWIKETYRPNVAGIKVIAMSAYVDGWETVSERVVAAGADGFLAKPFKLELLEKMITALLV